RSSPGATCSRSRSPAVRAAHFSFQVFAGAWAAARASVRTRRLASVPATTPTRSAPRLTSTAGFHLEVRRRKCWSSGSCGRTGTGSFIAFFLDGRNGLTRGFTPRTQRVGVGREARFPLLQPDHNRPHHPVAQVDADQVVPRFQSGGPPVVAVLPAGRIVMEEDARGPGGIGHRLVDVAGVGAVDLG